MKKLLLPFLLLPLSCFSMEKWSCGYDESKTVTNYFETGAVPPIIKKKEDGKYYEIKRKKKDANPSRDKMYETLSDTVNQVNLKLTDTYNITTLITLDRHKKTISSYTFSDTFYSFNYGECEISQ
jgi:hypothetical protein